MNGVNPSFFTGFAHSPGESKYPEYWKGLIGLWAPFLGVQGSKLFDLSGNGNHGALSGGYVWSGEHLVCTAASDPLAELAKTEILTVGTIVFGARNADGSVCGDKDTAATENYIWPRQGSYLRIRDNAAGDAQHNNITDFTGEHVWALSWDGTNSRSYKDGILQQTVALGGAFHLSDILAGYNLTSFDYDGNLKFLYAYSRVLTASELAFLRNHSPLKLADIPVGKAAAPIGANPKGPLGHPLRGPLAGPIFC